MKPKQQVLFFLVMGTMMSCGNNKLKTDEKKLKEQIMLTEKEKEQKLFADGEKALHDTLLKMSPGIQFHENRSVDHNHKPLNIDLAGNLQNKKKIKLSDVASTITYIRLDPLPDASMNCEMKSKYCLMDKFIVAINYNGIHLFNKEGKYLRTIVKNEYTGVEITSDRLHVRNSATFQGGGTSAWARGNNFYYFYSNTATGQHYLMEYDCNNQQLLSPGFDSEHPKKIIALGNVYLDMTHGHEIPKNPNKNANGMWGCDPDFLYQKMECFAPDKNTYVKWLYGDYMLGIFSNKGDTLTKFTMLEQLKNYTKSVTRGTDYGTNYQANGKLFYRNAFNDTLFQVIPPNRLLPVFVLKLETYKATKQQGMDPGFNLKGKIIPGEWAETKNFVYLTFAKNNYSCPNTRKKKEVEIYYALYSKKDHSLCIVDGDPFNYEPDLLENNLDGGMPVWPKAYMIGSNGEILVSLRGKELKAHVNSEIFSKSTAPAMKKNQLMQFVQKLSDSDDILGIVE